jgi:hypothetical protein
MRNSSSLSLDSLSSENNEEVKADPFALSDLDSLAVQILHEVAGIQDRNPGVDLSPVSNLARLMREKTAAVMKFFVDQVE